MSVVAELVKNVLETSFKQFDPAEVDRARSKLIDVVGCIIGGANAPGCSMLIDLVEEWGGRYNSGARDQSPPAQRGAGKQCDGQIL
jgi:2-methylcitrate dehydratase PrpD